MLGVFVGLCKRSESDIMKSLKEIQPKTCKKNKSAVDKWLTEDGLMLIECWARDGFTQEEISRKCGVSLSAFRSWRMEYPQIGKAFETGKEVIDYRVENALLKTALGYKTMETKTIIACTPDGKGNMPVKIERTEKEILPNVTAILAWLNNRKPDQWKRNRDNILETKDKDNKVTVNIIHQSSKKDEEWDVDSKIEENATDKPEEIANTKAIKASHKVTDYEKEWDDYEEDDEEDW